jgi:hypothetical protein
MENHQILVFIELVIGLFIIPLLFQFFCVDKKNEL